MFWAAIPAVAKLLGVAAGSAAASGGGAAAGAGAGGGAAASSGGGGLGILGSFMGGGGGGDNKEGKALEAGAVAEMEKGKAATDAMTRQGGGAASLESLEAENERRRREQEAILQRYMGGQ